jgi:hypothetical protein
MSLDFSTPGQLIADMSAYVKMVLAEAPANMQGRAPTLAENHLFKINEENPTILDEETADLYHLMTCSCDMWRSVVDRTFYWSWRFSARGYNIQIWTIIEN